MIPIARLPKPYRNCVFSRIARSDANYVCNSAYPKFRKRLGRTEHAQLEYISVSPIQSPNHVERKNNRFVVMAIESGNIDDRLYRPRAMPDEPRQQGLRPEMSRRQVTCY